MSQTTSRLQTPVSACATHALQLARAARRMACCPARKTTAARAKEPPACAPREDAAARAAEYVCSRAPTAAIRLSAAACSPAELTAPCKCIKARTVTTVPLCSLYGQCLASNVRLADKQCSGLSLYASRAIPARACAAGQPGQCMAAQPPTPAAPHCAFIAAASSGRKGVNKPIMGACSSCSDLSPL